MTLDASHKLLTGTKSLLFIPSENALEVEIVYDVISGEGANKSVVTNVVRSDAAVPNLYPSEHTLNITPKANSIYKINIHIGMTSAKFNAEVEEWKPADTTNHPVDLPSNKVVVTP